MSEPVTADRRASRAEVMRHAEAIRRLARDLGLPPLRMRDDGTVVIHSERPGYKDANRLAAGAGRIVGAYVHVITDDVPGAVSARTL